MHQVISVQYVKEYRIRIKFSDGLEGEIDLSDMVGKGVFSIWRNLEEFKKVSVDEETHTVRWPGGIDLAPEALYEDLKEQQRAA